MAEVTVRRLLKKSDLQLILSEEDEWWYYHEEADEPEPLIPFHEEWEAALQDVGVELTPDIKMALGLDPGEYWSDGENSLVVEQVCQDGFVILGGYDHISDHTVNHIRYRLDVGLAAIFSALPLLFEEARRVAAEEATKDEKIRLAALLGLED